MEDSLQSLCVALIIVAPFVIGIINLGSFPIWLSISCFMVSVIYFVIAIGIIELLGGEE